MSALCSHEKINIRLAAIADVDSCFPFDHHMDRDELTFKIKREDLVLATLDAVVIGYLRLEYLWSQHPFIAQIYILDAYRGQGIGTLLFCFLKKKLKNEGYTKLYSSSQSNEPMAQRWHLKMGFSLCGSIQGINKDVVDELFFAIAI